MKKRLSLLIFLTVFIASFLVWLMKPRSVQEQTIQGRPISHWVKDVKTEGFPDEQNPAFDVLIAEGPRIMPNLSRLLLTAESPKDNAFQLFHWLIPDEKKIRYENRSDILALKANSAWMMGVIAYQNPNAPEVQASIPSFISALQSSSRFVRSFSAQGLGAIGEGASNAVPHLISAMSAADSSTRMSAAEALGRIGINTPPVIRALNDATADLSNSVSATAAQALLNLQESTPNLLLK